MEQVSQSRLDSGLGLSQFSVRRPLKKNFKTETLHLRPGVAGGAVLLLLHLYSRTGPRRAVRLTLSDARVYAPEIRTPSSAHALPSRWVQRMRCSDMLTRLPSLVVWSQAHVHRPAVGSYGVVDRAMNKIPSINKFPCIEKFPYMNKWLQCPPQAGKFAEAQCLPPARARLILTRES